MLLEAAATALFSCQRMYAHYKALKQVRSTAQINP